MLLWRTTLRYSSLLCNSRVCQTHTVFWKRIPMLPECCRENDVCVKTHGIFCDQNKSVTTNFFLKYTPVSLLLEANLSWRRNEFKGVELNWNVFLFFLRTHSLTHSLATKTRCVGWVQTLTKPGCRRGAVSTDWTSDLKSRTLGESQPVSSKFKTD